MRGTTLRNHYIQSQLPSPSETIIAPSPLALRLAPASVLATTIASVQSRPLATVSGSDTAPCMTHHSGGGDTRALRSPSKLHWQTVVGHVRVAAARGVDEKASKLWHRIATLDIKFVC